MYIQDYFGFCRCDISLQNTHIGEAKAMSKNNARNLAAASALFKLYETQDVIKVCSVQSFMKIFLLLGILPLKTYGNYLDYFFDYL